MSLIPRVTVTHGRIRLVWGLGHAEGNLILLNLGSVSCFRPHVCNIGSFTQLFHFQSFFYIWIKKLALFFFSLALLVVMFGQKF